MSYRFRSLNFFHQIFINFLSLFHSRKRILFVLTSFSFFFPIYFVQDFSSRCQHQLQWENLCFLSQALVTIFQWIKPGSPPSLRYLGRTLHGDKIRPQPCNLRSSPGKVIQDSLGFWIAHITCRSVKLGFQNSVIVTGIQELLRAKFQITKPRFWNLTTGDKV